MIKSTRQDVAVQAMAEREAADAREKVYGTREAVYGRVAPEDNAAAELADAMEASRAAAEKARSAYEALGPRTRLRFALQIGRNELLDALTRTADPAVIGEHLDTVEKCIAMARGALAEMAQ